MSLDPEFRADWRPRSRRVRRFFANYLKWVVRGGYAFVLVSFAALVVAIAIRVDNTVSTQGGDPGTLRARGEAYTAPASLIVLQLRAKPGAHVQKGDALMDVARLPLEDRADTPAALLPRETLRAPASGTFILTDAGRKRLASSGEELFRVVDYSTIEVVATVRGETIAEAAIGQPVTLTRFDADRDGKVLARVQVDGEAITSERLLPDSAREELLAALRGQAFAVRNDRQLALSGVELLEVDLEASAAQSTPDLLDPASDAELRGTVIAGSHRAKVQFSHLRPSEQEVVARLVADRAESAGLPAAEVKNTVVQVWLEGPGKPLAEARSREGREVSVVERTFEITVQVTNPPDWLTQLLREQDREGKVVRCRVDVATGKTPLALRLLKR